MKHLFIILSAVFFFYGNETTPIKISEDTTIETARDPLKVFKYDELEAYLKNKDDSKTYVINFWATWCAPCVKELPYFESLNANYTNKNVEVILVSLDFPKQIETKLIPFLKKKALKSEVVVLNKEKSKFYERSFNYNELETELKQFIK